MSLSLLSSYIFFFPNITGVSFFFLVELNSRFQDNDTHRTRRRFKNEFVNNKNGMSFRILDDRK